MRLIDTALLYAWLQWCNGLLRLAMFLLFAATKTVPPTERKRPSNVGLWLFMRAILGLALIKAHDLTYSFWRACHMAGRRSP
jgi:hypothetical protein